MRRNKKASGDYLYYFFHVPLTLLYTIKVVRAHPVYIYIQNIFTYYTGVSAKIFESKISVIFQQIFVKFKMLIF
jgi:hypothetical protein